MAFDGRLNAIREPVRERDHRREGLVGQDVFQGGAGRCDRQRVSSQRATYPADIDQVQVRMTGHALSELVREAVRGCRNPAGDRLPDGQHVGVQAPGPGATARAC